MRALIFGYPGGSIMPVYDALFDYTRGEKKCFDHILVRHEQGATHAAEGYARVSGEVGVALVTSGPGVTNTLTGIADAMLDSTPIVVIAGQVPISALGTDAFQEVDLVGVSQPISKWSYQIRHAEDVSWAVSRAFYIARTGRPGPVVLDFAKNAQVEEIDYDPQKVRFIRSYVPYPKLDAEAVRQAAELINNAKKPLALVPRESRYPRRPYDARTLRLALQPSVERWYAGYARQLRREYEGAGVRCAHRHRHAFFRPRDW